MPLGAYNYQSFKCGACGGTWKSTPTYQLPFGKEKHRPNCNSAVQATRATPVRPAAAKTAEPAVTAEGSRSGDMTETNLRSRCS